VKNENGAYAIDESLLENGLNELEDREYQGLLDQLKMIMIQFINNLDLHEVYQFVNFFPFLVDKNELQKIVEADQEEALEYEAQVHYQIDNKIALSDGEDDDQEREDRSDSSGNGRSSASSLSPGSAQRRADGPEAEDLSQNQDPSYPSLSGDHSPSMAQKLQDMNRN